LPADRSLRRACGHVDGYGRVGGVRRSAEPDAVHDLLHDRNIVLAGTSLVPGRATGVVFATGGRSEFGKIARLTQAAEEPLPRSSARSRD
jgi:sodium/potassium-transporting ATPase subunit alpha